jgi:hypothetical protein
MFDLEHDLDHRFDMESGPAAEPQAHGRTGLAISQSEVPF